MHGPTAFFATEIYEPVTLPRALVTWTPVVVGPAVIVACLDRLAPWAAMVLLTGAIFFGFKWVTYRRYRADVGELPLGRTLGYLLTWPGMDAEAFFAPTNGPIVLHARDWLPAATKTLLGIAALWIGVRLVEPRSTFWAGWLGLAGLMLVLHFGLLQLSAYAWRRAGVQVKPIMNHPLYAASLSEFWGRRWNRAFRDLAESLIYRPFVRHVGQAGALMAVFLFSGLVHDLVISVPARTGYGRPTLYFLLQGAALLFARALRGRNSGIRRDVTARLFAAIVLVAPLGLLFHRPFVERVVVPLLHVIGCF